MAAPANPRILLMVTGGIAAYKACYLTRLLVQAGFDVKLVDAARDVRAGMIVMGAFGRNRITDYFIGSNASAVVRTSPIPVLLAR